jgi:plastocyanin
MKKITLFLGILVLMVFIAGCGQQQAAITAKQEAAKQASQAAQQTSSEEMSATVRIYDTGFRPEEVTIARGGTVTWTNYGSESHTINGATFPMPSSNSPKTSGRLQPGESWTKKFDETGYFGYTDMYDGNLKGKVVVK